jgi:hypothetical protein
MSETRCEGQQCWAHIDWFCEHAGLARVFNGDQDFGDPYCYALAFVVREKFDKPLPNGKKGLIEFVGVIKVMSMCQYRALGDAMYKEGWGVLSTRKKNGKDIVVEVYKSKWEN